jgi:D-amino-acid dehydrogenase
MLAEPHGHGAGQPGGGAPRHVAVVGAGMVGLATAWFLQERGVQVTVLEREHVAAGASWGNAGWLTPSLVAPLPEPAVLSYGVRAMLSTSSPVYVPPAVDPPLWRFLAGFAKHSTARRWSTGLRAYVPVNRRCLGAFEALAAGGVEARAQEAQPLLACFRGDAARDAMVRELEHLRAAGQQVDFDVITGEEARGITPALSDRVASAVRLRGQRYIDPPAFMQALAEAVRARGGVVREGVAVRAVDGGAREVVLDTGAAEGERYDAVVLATGSRFGELTRRHGVRRAVQAGRGYSFSVGLERQPTNPVYFPAERVGCTPLGDRLRLAGMMEFRKPGAPLDRRRVAAIAAAVGPLLDGVDLEDRKDEWVGSRPCTADGLPLIGRTRCPRVHAAGGHGMWGIALGPITGQLVAESVSTGVAPPELTPFDPLR